MKKTVTSRSIVPWLAAGAGAAAGAYAAWGALAWARYGHPLHPRPEEADDLLDRFMADYEIVERHSVEVAAPADITLAVAREMDLSRLPVARAIFKVREVVMGARPAVEDRPRGLLAEVLSLGWIVLAEMPGREVVVGAVTRPWEPNVVFRSVPPEEFAGFAEPDYVKIAWTLRADPAGPDKSVFRTETRAVCTDAAARERFRLYWACCSPGIALIRRVSLGPIRAEAERRARAVPVTAQEELTPSSAL